MPALALVVALLVSGPATSTVRATEDTPGTLRLMAVGDLMLAGGVGKRIKREGPDAPWVAVAEQFAAADLVIANLECTVSERGKPWPKRNTFRAPLIAADALASGGIDIVNLANNHALDYGVQAFKDTLGLLDQRAIGHVGGGSNRAAARAPYIVERNGLRVAFLGYILPNSGPDPWYPGLWNARKSRPGLAVGTPSAVSSDIAAVRAAVDVVVVVFHGGGDHRKLPSAQVRQFTAAAIGAGASLVIGHHPDVLQGYQSGAGTLVAFSLGRFVSDRGSLRSHDSAILDVTLSSAGVTSFNWIPVEIELGFPRPARESEISRITKRLQPV